MSADESPWFDHAAAYALDALDGDDLVGFERELAVSPELRARVDEFRAALEPLAGDLDPVEPPAAMKASIFDRLDDAPQQAATDDPSERAETAEPDGFEQLHLVEPGEQVPDAAPVADFRPEPGPAEQRAQRRWFQRPVALMASAAAAVVLISGAVVGINWGGENGLGAQRELQAIESADDASSSEFSVSGGGSITLVSSATVGRSAIRAEDLPDAGPGSTYELWYIDEAGAVPAGTFDPVDGDAWLVLEGDFRPGILVGVTVEPEGGSEQPTTDPIALVEA